MTRYRSAVFGNRGLQLERKVQLFRQLILSAIIFSSPAWHVLSNKEQEIFEKGIFSLYKRFGMMHFGREAKHWTNIQLCAELQVESPSVLLRVGRLRYLQHLVRCGQPQLWAVLQQDSTWWQQLQNDYEWLRPYLPSEFVVERFFENWSLLAPVLQRSGGRWKGAIKRTLKAHLYYEQIKFKWEEWHEAIVHRIGNHFGLNSPIEDCCDTEFFCILCRRVFPRAAALSVHAFKIHGRVAKARRFAQGTQCANCLKDFHSTLCLVNHLKYNATCLARAICNGPVEDVRPGLNSRTEKKDRSALPLPYVYAAGPLPLPLDHSERVLEEDEQALVDAWSAALQACGAENDIELLESLRKATLRTTMFPQQISDLFSWWLLHGVQEHLVPLHLFAVGHRYLQSFSREWFFSLDTEEPRAKLRWRECLDYWLKHKVRLVPQPTAGPHYKPYVIAHLFSGRRRDQDIQHFVEEGKGILRGALAVSVDVIFDVTFGDLLNPKTMAIFKQAIRENRIHALIAGPPCETWSRARDGRDGGPRPLRSIEQPWSLTHLMTREYKQTAVGNALLGSALELFVEALLAQTLMLLEHPAPPADVEKPSIWKLEIMRLLYSCTNCQRITLSQGYFGAKSPKPTTFLIANGLEDAAAFFANRKTRTHLPTFRSIGKDDKGSWHTSSLKEYPPDLCRTIVAYVEATLRANAMEQFNEQPAEFLESLRNLVQNFNFEAEMGPDFAG